MSSDTLRGMLNRKPPFCPLVTILKPFCNVNFYEPSERVHQSVCYNEYVDIWCEHAPRVMQSYVEGSKLVSPQLSAGVTHLLMTDLCSPGEHGIKWQRCGQKQRVLGTPLHPDLHQPLLRHPCEQQQ